MRKRGVKRVVTMSTSSHAQFQADRDDAAVPRLARGMAKDDVAGIELLEASGLDWTIVNATLLKNKPATGYRRVDADKEVTGRDHVNRADVAECLLAALDDRSLSGGRC